MGSTSTFDQGRFNPTLVQPAPVAQAHHGRSERLGQVRHSRILFLFESRYADPTRIDEANSCVWPLPPR